MARLKLHKWINPYTKKQIAEFYRIYLESISKRNPLRN